jgi:MFS family permease
MDKALKRQILKDTQIKKFCLYGFLKDLRFFEPYLVIYLLSNDLTLLKIGILVSIREIIINIFEIPSGFVADYWGRKKELCICFIFYIISFIFFFFTKNFGIAVVAMVFFGLGEAFRSGTHKSMIYTYLEEKNWQDSKAYVYGRTRSASLIGCAISSVLGILIVLNIPSSGYIFLAAIIPYLIDFVLIMTYPKSLDCCAKAEKKTFKEMLITFKKSILHNRLLRCIMMGEGVFEGIVSSIKDYIQPIMELLIVGSGIVILTQMTANDNLLIILGIIYAINNIVGSISSRRAYLFKKIAKNNSLINGLYLALALILLLLGFLINQPLIVCIFYLMIYIVQNLRKPIYMDEIDNCMDKSERATMLSVSSQLKSIVLIIIAPIMGYIADTYGISYIMYGLAVLLIVLLPFTFLYKKSN